MCDGGEWEGVRVVVPFPSSCCVGRDPRVDRNKESKEETLERVKCGVLWVGVGRYQVREVFSVSCQGFDRGS